MLSLIIFLLIGMLGMLCHYVKRYLKEQTSVTLWYYIFFNKKSTVSAAISTVVAILGLISTQHIDFSTQSIALAFLAGYGSDSVMNSE